MAKTRLVWIVFGIVWVPFGIDWTPFGFDWNAFGIVWMSLDCDVGIRRITQNDSRNELRNRNRFT